MQKVGDAYPTKTCKNRKYDRVKYIGNQIDDHLVVNQWPTPPILGYVAEHPMLNLVPFARAWRKVAHINSQIRLIGKLLQLHFP